MCCGKPKASCPKKDKRLVGGRMMSARARRTLTPLQRKMLLPRDDPRNMAVIATNPFKNRKVAIHKKGVLLRAVYPTTRPEFR